VVFKEVVPVRREDVRAKIHQTYRIGYIKDVILPRVLDDTTFATLSSLMMFNNVEVLMCLQVCRGCRGGPVDESVVAGRFSGLQEWYF
jgi:hypothetical protein